MSSTQGETRYYRRRITLSGKQPLVYYLSFPAGYIVFTDISQVDPDKVYVAFNEPITYIELSKAVVIQGFGIKRLLFKWEPSEEGKSIEIFYSGQIAVVGGGGGATSQLQPMLIVGGGLSVDALTLRRINLLEVVDTAPNDYLRVVFDANVPANTESNVSIDAPEGAVFIPYLAELHNDSEAYGEAYLVLIDGSEIPLIKDTEAGKNYYVDVDDTVGIVPCKSIVLKAYTTTATSKQNIVELRYSAKIIKQP